MITNPENLSKDRLKTELKRKGIDFGTQENKKYYVDLYRKKVMDVQSLRSEFSDDDVPSSPGPKRKAQRSRKSKKESLISYINNLQDDELMDELVDFGEDPGPITPLTRDVYERKLAKLMDQEGTPRRRPLPPKEAEPVVNDSFIGEWSDEDEDQSQTDDGEVEAPAGRAYNLRRRDTPSQDSVDRRPRRRSPAKSKAPPTQTLSPPVKSSPHTSRRRVQGGSDMCRTLWSFFLLVVVFLAVFLLYEHITVPDGKTSILTNGCDSLHNAILRVFGPLMERQEAEPGSGSAELPPEEIKPGDPPVRKPIETPPTDEPKKTTANPKTAKPKTAKKPKTTSDKPKTDTPPPTDKPAASEPPPAEKPQTAPKPNPDDKLKES